MTGGDRPGTPFRGTDGRLLARNVGINLTGQLVPAAAAVVALPLLARLHRADVLGLLTVAWVVLGYFGLLDLGLGRALTLLVASGLGSGRRARIPGLVWTTSFMLAALGVAAAVAVAASADWVATSALRVPPDLVSDTRRAVYLLAVAVPFLTLSAGLRGLLEAHQRFDLVNLVRMPAGALMYLGPLLAAPFSRSLSAGVLALVTVRVLACVAFAALAVRIEPGIAAGVRLSAAAWRRAAGAGTWMTLANLAATMLGYLDRVVVGAIVPVASVAYYATPQEVLTKLLAVPAAVAGVLFPAFGALSNDDGPRLKDYLRRSWRYTFALLFPVTLVLAATAPEWLAIALGPEFGTRGAAPVQWFCLGILANGLALTPFTFTQARGGSATVAVLQLVELPLFAAAFFAAARYDGIRGAAAAWSLRALVDLVCLSIAARSRLAASVRPGLRGAAAALLVPALFILLMLLPSAAARVLVAGLGLALAAAVAARTADEVEWDAAGRLWRRVLRPGA